MKHGAQYPAAPGSRCLKGRHSVNAHIVITRASTNVTKLGREKNWPHCSFRNPTSLWLGGFIPTPLSSPSSPSGFYWSLCPESWHPLLPTGPRCASAFLFLPCWSEVEHCTRCVALFYNDWRFHSPAKWSSIEHHILSFSIRGLAQLWTLGSRLMKVLRGNLITTYSCKHLFIWLFWKSIYNLLSNKCWTPESILGRSVVPHPCQLCDLGQITRSLYFISHICLIMVACALQKAIIVMM